MWNIQRVDYTRPDVDASPYSAESLFLAISRFAPRPEFTAGQYTYCCMLEALLIGHEDWVHSAQWSPLREGQKLHDR